MSKSLLELSIDCCNMLSNYSEDIDHELDPMKITDEPAWQAWVQAVCDDPDFLMRTDGNFFAVYKKCRHYSPDRLTRDEARGCITFLLEQILLSPAPHKCLADGTFGDFLMRWAVLEVWKDDDDV